MNAITRRQSAERLARADTPGALHVRATPHNLEAEQALLGAILVNNEAHDRVSGFLEAHHFYDPLHHQIYETLSKLIASGKQATPITLRTFFENAEPIDATTTVPVYLGKLAINATTIINARDYARTIHHLYTRRQLIIIGEDVVNRAFDSPVDFSPKEQIEEVETRLFSLAERGSNERADVSLADAMGIAIDDVQAAYSRLDGLAGVSTGIPPLDEKTGGVVASDLVILAGRTSMGKTALAVNIALNLARADISVGFFSLEMAASQLAMRTLAEASGVPSWDLRRGKITEADMRNLLKAAERFSGLPLRIDQSGGLTMAQLASKARRMCRKRGCKVLFVDYLQLIGGSVYRGHNRTQEITEVTTGLKSLAKELGVCVVALAQLSRAVEGRDNKRPQLSDLRESGSIEQDADLVWFVFREEYYLERERPGGADEVAFQKWSDRMSAARGKAEIIIGKQRHGPLDTVPLDFDAASMTFKAPAVGGAS